MKRLFRYIGLLLLNGSFLLAPAYVHAEASVLATADRLMLIERADTVELILGLSVDAADQSTLVVPVPGRPAASAVRDGAQLFGYLAEVTQPAIRVETRYIIGIPPFVDPVPTTLPAPSAPPPLPPADIRVYMADDPLTLADSLAVHELTLDAADHSILGAHLASGGTVLIVTFADSLAADALPALQLSYSGAAPPMNPAPAPFELFVVAAGRRVAASLETLYAGPVRAIDPAPPADLLPLLAPDMYVTHLRGSEVDAAITLQAAPTNEPLRRTSVVQEEVYLFERSSTTIGLGLVACLSLLALVGAVTIRRRLDAISPDP